MINVMITIAYTMTLIRFYNQVEEVNMGFGLRMNPTRETMMMQAMMDDID